MGLISSNQTAEKGSQQLLDTDTHTQTDIQTDSLTGRLALESYSLDSALTSCNMFKKEEKNREEREGLLLVCELTTGLTFFIWKLLMV